MLTPLERIKAVLLAAPENSVAFKMAQELRLVFEMGNGSITDDKVEELAWLEEAITRILLPGMGAKTENITTLLSEDIKPTSWLIENIWTDASRGFIAGHPGVGKTWFALDLMLSVASGRPFLGLYQVKRQANCLLVEEESSREALKTRLHLLTQGHHIEKEELNGKVFTLTRQFVKIHKHRDELRAIIEKRKIGLIVFDSFRTIHDSKESSSDDMAIVLQELAELQVESDINIILIHHLRKSVPDRSGTGSIWEQLRGSGHIWAWRDCIIGMEQTEDPFAAACQFQFRDAEPGAPLVIRREMPDDKSSLTLVAEKQEDWTEFREECEAIRNELATSFEPVSATKLREKLKRNKANVLAALRYLAAKKEVVKVGSGPATAWQLSTGSTVSTSTDGTD